MKKLLAILLSSLMFMSFAACGTSKEADLEAALQAADAYVEKTDSEYMYYIIDSSYDEIGNIYTVNVYADEEAILSQLNEYQSNKYYDVLLHTATKHYDDDTETISTIMAFLGSSVKSSFEFSKTDTEVILRYINTDKTIVNYN